MSRPGTPDQAGEGASDLDAAIVLAFEGVEQIEMSWDVPDDAPEELRDHVEQLRDTIEVAIRLDYRHLDDVTVEEERVVFSAGETER